MNVCPDYQSDSDSFNPTLWEEQRQQRMTVAFDFEDKKEEEDNSGKVKVRLAVSAPEQKRFMLFLILFCAVSAAVRASVDSGPAPA